MSGTHLLFARAWLNCRECKLHKDRQRVVLGFGNPRADVMVIGEGPGAEEDRVGIPFVGASGELLDDFLYRLKWDRDDLFLDNTVACRPTKESDRGMVNRPPDPSEMIACRWRLWETIYRIDPLLIVSMGASALKGLTGTTDSITKARGELYMMKIPGFYKKITYPVLPTFHPSFLLRNASTRKGAPMDQFWEDLKMAKKIYNRLQVMYKKR